MAWIVAPKKICPQELCMWPHLEKRSLQMNEARDLRMRSISIVLVGPKSNDRHLYETEMKTQTQGKGMWRQTQRLKWYSCEKCFSSTRTWKRHKSFSPRPFEGSAALLTTWFWISGPESWDNNVYYFKPLRLWLQQP